MAGRLRALALAVVVLAPAAPPAFAQSVPAIDRHAAVDPELAADLLGWASRLSGMASPPGVPMPLFLPLPPVRFAAVVCPDSPTGCRSLVALYDTERARIVYRNTLDMREPTDQSFIVHELVHHLQFLMQGDALFATCRSTMAAEEQAYRAQNLYQKHFRQWQRMGEMMRFMHCEDDASSGPLVRVTGSPVGPPDR